MSKIGASLASAAVLGLLGGAGGVHAAPAIKNVVLVHGGFVDGSGWEGVYDILTKDGYTAPSFRTRRPRWRTTSPSPAAPLQPRTAPPFSWAIPTAAW